MLRKTMIALLAAASVGLVAPTMAFARGGGGGGGGMAAAALAVVDFMVAALEAVGSMVVVSPVDSMAAGFTAAAFMAAALDADWPSARLAPG